MDIKQAVIEALKELIVPDMEEIKSELKVLSARQEEMSKRLDDLHGQIIYTNQRIDVLSDSLNERIDETNRRIDRLYEVIVRREEHDKLERRIEVLERDIVEIKEKVMAM